MGIYDAQKETSELHTAAILHNAAGEKSYPRPQG
jgi:hypothetical protein